MTIEKLPIKIGMLSKVFRQNTHVIIIELGAKYVTDRKRGTVKSYV